MKKLFALVFVLILSLTFLVGCEMPEPIGGIVDTVLDQVGGVTEIVKDKVNDILGKEPEGNPQLDAADELLFNLYKDDATETPFSYDLVTSVTVDGVQFKVSWISNNEVVTIVAAEDPAFVTVVIPRTNELTRYALTATIEDDAGNVKTRTFARIIPAFKVFTFAEYAAAADGAPVVVRGVISGILSSSDDSSEGGLYIQDLKNEGGYFVYGSADADLGLEVGMTVTVSGAKATYNGLYRVENATVEIDDATVKNLQPVDFTSIYENSTSLTDSALVAGQSMLVTVRGVEIGGVKEEDGNGYYFFKLGALESYIGISSSRNCITADDIDTLKAAHTAHKSYMADVTGIVQLGGDGKFYLIPVSVDAEYNYREIQRSDAQKVEVELAELTLPAKIEEACDLTVLTTGAIHNTVSFIWAADKDFVTYADGKLTFTYPEVDTKVTVTVTATCGIVTETKTFEVMVLAKPIVPATDAEKVAAEKDALNLKTEIFADTEIEVPVAGATYPEVTVTWTVDGTAVENGKIAIAIGKTSKTVTIVATVKCGEAVETLEFTVFVAGDPDAVEAPLTSDINTSTVGSGADNYTERVSANGWNVTNAQLVTGKEWAGATNYGWIICGKVGANGVITSPKFNGTVEAVKFGYGTPYVGTGVKLTVGIVGADGTVLASDVLERYDLVQDTAYEYIWILTAEEKALLTGDSRLVITNECLPDNDGGIMVYDICIGSAPHVHTYDDDCDAVCNDANCNEERVAPHVYDNACDGECNECGETRTPADHVYDNACDANCNVCNGERTPADHVYDDDCDATCNVCNGERTAPHVYDNACDGECNECGETRIPADHAYDHGCDTTCNECGDTRENLYHSDADDDGLCDNCQYELDKIGDTPLVGEETK